MIALPICVMLFAIQLVLLRIAKAIEDLND